MRVDTSQYPRAYFGDTSKQEEPVVTEPEQVVEEVEAPKPTKNTARSTKDELNAAKREMYLKQESKRAPKVQIDQKLVLWTWITGIVIAFIASAIVSFNGITAVAQFVGLSADWMGGLFFFFIELMYLLFLIAYLVLSSRVDEEGNRERTGGAFWGMFAFGAIAIVANGFHTLDYWQYEWLEPRMWAGAVLSISAPIAIISASKMASRVVFAKAISL